ncbi:MAG: trypsin-like peptidase domain-containing protein [Alphaproteobacteria bacterium]|nr:trypsin-like peptidase domain-containing protein [Alphaproteobacteria bacterium]
MKHNKLILAIFLITGFCQNVLARADFPSFADLAEKLLPSVVNISTTTLNEDGAEDIAPETETLGSGFIISKDGYIVTNQHVINKAKVINVTLFNNEKIEAEIIGEDKKTDLAVLKITTETPLTPVAFGNSDTLRVGDWVLAIGNPFGLGGSVTAGIVSAKSRDIESGSYDNFIQTDAAINQGNSGGPMFNLQGEVIGVNSAIFSTTGESMGIGFATPSKMAEWVISQLRSQGKVTRGWIGIAIKPAPHPYQGILISRITENSPASKAGFSAGDIITKFNTMPITSATNLSRIIAESRLGELLNFEILRNGQIMTLQVAAEEMPDEETKTQAPVETPAPATEEQAVAPEPIEETPQEADISQEKDSQKSPLGLEINNTTAELLAQYKLPTDSKGVIITAMDGQSDASEKGIQVGDLITKVDKKEVFDIISFNDYIKQAQNENNRPVLLTIQNSEAEHFVAVKLK